MSNVLSLSGGIDSTSLLLNLLSNNENVYALTFDYGQKHKIEIEFAKKNIDYLAKSGFEIKHQIINISDLVNILQSSLTDNQIEVPEGHYENKNMIESRVNPTSSLKRMSVLYSGDSHETLEFQQAVH